MRALARDLTNRLADWELEQVVACCDILMASTVLEVKQLGVEMLARYHRQFKPPLLMVCRRWLADNFAANWATTDALCGYVIARLLERDERLVPRVVAWSRHRSLWVRRAAAVSLVAGARRGRWLDDAYEVVTLQMQAPEDLIHKALGWLLREAGRQDAERLATFLRRYGPQLSRTTVRYAIERFAAGERRALLAATRGTGSAPTHMPATTSSSRRASSPSRRRRDGR